MHVTFAQLIAALSLCLAVALPADAQPVDQLPMYGGLDRKSESSLRAADEKLIADVTRHYGSREKASMAFVENGFSFYGRDDLESAMRRFNQAWLLDPNNPEVYFGFAVVLHDKGKSCEAVTQFEKAASFGRFIKGMAPDAARVLVLCAVGDKSLSEVAKAALLVRSDALYAEALINESDKGYVHASMASAMYWRGKYAEAWVAVKLARANGGRLPEQFLRLLQEKMPEPA
jgi:Tfp pilus assembly protein PilF